MLEIDEILTRFRDVVPAGDEWSAHCPGHDDSTKSLSIGQGEGGRILLKCFAGCQTEHVLRSAGLTWRDLFSSGPSAKGCTLNDYAAMKRLDQTYLVDAFGLEDTRYLDLAAVRLLYLAIDGTEEAVRYRIDLEGKDRFRWRAGDKASTLYGLWRLDEIGAAGRVVLVEGESDTQTLWSQEIPSLGIAGASQWKDDIHAPVLAGIENIYIVIEPDKGGRTLASELAASALAPRIRAIDLSPLGFTDVSDMYVDDPNLFKGRWEQALSHHTVPIAEAVSAMPEPLAETLTDAGNARRFARQHKDDVRYCSSLKSWFVWDEKRWRKDDGDGIERRAKETAFSIYDEAKAASDAARAEALGKWGRSSESKQRLNALVDLARTEVGIAVAHGDLDSDPWLLNCDNGTIDLRSGEIRPHNRRDLITKIAPVVYDPHAVDELWTRVLAEAVPEAVAAFLARAVGYSATGLTTEEVFFFILGPQASFKSTFVEAIKGTLGEYAMTANFETFLSGRAPGSPRPDLARLPGARIVTAAEATRGGRLDEGLLKGLTGGDAVTTRDLYKGDFTFFPTFTLWFVANDAPIIRSDDGGMWRRTKRIAFDRTIPEGKRDPSVKTRLKQPSSGLLAWIVRGCLEWQRVGLAVPDEVRISTDSYREEMDLVAPFLRGCCVQDPDGFVSSDLLYGEYERFCAEEGLNKLGKRNFLDDLAARGYAADRQYSKILKRTVRGRSGLRLLEQSDGSDATDADSHNSSKNVNTEELVDIASEPSEATESHRELRDMPSDKKRILLAFLWFPQGAKAKKIRERCGVPEHPFTVLLKKMVGLEVEKDSSGSRPSYSLTDLGTQLAIGLQGQAASSVPVPINEPYNGRDSEDELYEHVVETDGDGSKEWNFLLKSAALSLPIVQITHDGASFTPSPTCTGCVALRLPEEPLLTQAPEQKVWQALFDS